MENVCVTNENEIYVDEECFPECIIVVDVETEDIIEYNHSKYELLTDILGVRLFELSDE